MCRSLLLLVLGSGLLLGPAAGVQAAPPSEAEMIDLWQTLRVRKLLLDDPLLGELNLGVRVANRVATLWGPVPSVELAVRAEQLVRTMWELNDVRNRLVIDEPLLFQMKPKPATPQFLPDALPPALPKPAVTPWNRSVPPALTRRVSEGSGVSLAYASGW